MQKRIWLFPVLSCAALAACSTGPAYKRPNIALPAQWHEASSSGDTGGAVEDRPATPTPTWPERQWWRGFGSAQLDQLIVEAERNNDDIAAAIARVQEADAQARIAGAPLLPTLDAGAAVTRARQQVPGLGPGTSTLYSPALSANYELDFWGKNRALREAARAAAAASSYDRETVALSVVTSVAVTYFQVLELRDRIDVAQENLANAQTILRGLTLEESVGTATGLDVAQQAATVAALNATVPPLSLQFQQAVNALAVLLGKTPESLEIGGGTMSSLSLPPVIAGLPSQLLSRRPDVAEAEQQLVSANANIKAARAAMFPSIELTAGGGYESTALSTLLQPANRIYSLSAGLTQPIFHGGALQGQYAYARARYTELLTSYHKTVLTALSNVEDALVAVRETAEQQQRQQEAVTTARRAFDFAQQQLAAGTVNVLTVLSTENALFTAQDALLQVKFSRLQALVNLFNALGGGWQQG
jgi:NodT family efflux transporter outer membrane factor (OMF) lipoprotein